MPTLCNTDTLIGLSASLAKITHDLSSINTLIDGNLSPDKVVSIRQILELMVDNLSFMSAVLLSVEPTHNPNTLEQEPFNRPIN